jgi:hypothetical protein
MTRRPGRPAVGPRVSVRFDETLLARVDTLAARTGESRASTIRRLVERSVGDTGVDVAQIRRALAMTPVDRIREAVRTERALARLRGRASP